MAGAILTLLKFFPESFYQAFDLSGHLAKGMNWHFVLMWVFFGNGLPYVLYTLFSGEWRYLLPTRHSFREALDVVLHDVGLSKKPLPVRKFNGAQQIAYTSVVLMGLGALLTGLAIYKPVQFSWLTVLLGGYGFARILHFALTIGYMLFFWCTSLRWCAPAGTTFGRWWPTLKFRRCTPPPTS